MKEYNWRKEREKYRPEFRKSEPELRQESAPELPIGGTDWRKVAFTAGVLLVVVFIVLAAALSGGSSGRDTAPAEAAAPATSGGDSAAQLSQAAEEYKSAVGLVTLSVEFQNGRKVVQPIGTAWAFAADKFATNAHVAQGIRETLNQVKAVLIRQILEESAKNAGCKSLEEFLKKLGENKAQQVVQRVAAQVEQAIRQVDAAILINGSNQQSYPISHVQIHRGYGVVNSKYNPDVAVLTIQGKHGSHFNLAPPERLHALKSGDPIAFLGFPMENLSSNNVNLDNPVASMQSGIVVAVSDFELKDAGGDGNVLIRHNLPATGGASGSPIFDRNGEVVGLLFAINVVGQVQQKESGITVQRAPSGAQINFGIRSDLLSGVGSPVTLGDFLK